MASFGIIYASGSKMVRRIISNSTNLSVHVGPGEALLVLERDQCPNVFEAQDAVEAATGVKPASIQCAIVDSKGAIKDIILADPAIDSVKNHDLVEIYEGVTKHCTYDAVDGVFVAPIEVVKAGTVLKDGTVVKEDIQTGGILARPVEEVSVDAIAEPPITRSVI